MAIENMSGLEPKGDRIGNSKWGRILAVALLLGSPSCGPGANIEAVVHRAEVMTAATKEAERQQHAYLEQAPIELPPTPVPGLLSTEMILCDDIEAGESIGEAVMEANGGQFPPYVFGGVEMGVGVYHQGEEPKRYSLQDLFDQNSEKYSEPPIVYPGDEVCISINPDKLDSHE